MTDATQVLLPVTPEDYALAETVVCASNIVSHDGYYEVDIDRAAAAIARHRQAHSLPGDVGMRELIRELLPYAEAASTSCASNDDYMILCGLIDKARAALTPTALSGDAGEGEWEGELTSEEQAMIDRAWDRHVAAGPQCEAPPEGWICTRGAGHEGPCAALPAHKGAGE